MAKQRKNSNSGSSSPAKNSGSHVKGTKYNRQGAESTRGSRTGTRPKKEGS